MLLLLVIFVAVMKGSNFHQGSTAANGRLGGWSRKLRTDLSKPKHD